MAYWDPPKTARQSSTLKLIDTAISQDESALERTQAIVQRFVSELTGLNIPQDQVQEKFSSFLLSGANIQHEDIHIWLCFTLNLDHIYIGEVT